MRRVALICVCLLVMFACSDDGVANKINGTWKSAVMEVTIITEDGTYKGTALGKSFDVIVKSAPPSPPVFDLAYKSGPACGSRPRAVVIEHETAVVAGFAGRPFLPRGGRTHPVVGIQVSPLAPAGCGGLQARLRGGADLPFRMATTPGLPGHPGRAPDHRPCFRIARRDQDAQALVAGLPPSQGLPAARRCPANPGHPLRRPKPGDLAAHDHGRVQGPIHARGEIDGPACRAGHLCALLARTTGPPCVSSVWPAGYAGVPDVFRGLWGGRLRPGRSLT